MVRGIIKNFYFPNVDIKRFFTLGFKNYIIQMVAVTADTHLQPFFLNGLLELVQGPRTMFENLGLEVPHKKKSQGLKSGERGGHGTASCKETTRPENTSFKIERGRRAVWAVAPSCWNQKSSRLCSFPTRQFSGAENSPTCRSFDWHSQ
jgi:hypothetical protein